MDDVLKSLADVSVAVGDAEEQLEAGGHLGARERLDEAASGLEALRARWPALSPPERRILGAAASPVRARLDVARARLPHRATLREVAPEPDPEEEVDPAA